MNNKPVKHTWESYQLGDILSLVIDHRGLTPKKLGGDWSTTGIQTISAMNIKGGKIVNHDQIRFVDENLYKKWMHEEIHEGDLILTSEAPLGEGYLTKSNDKFCLSQRLFAIRPKNSILDSTYLYYFLTSDLGKKALHDRSTGTTAKGIRQTELVKVKVPIPLLPVQKRIAKIVATIDESIDKTDQIIKKVELLKQGIIGYLFEKAEKNPTWQLTKLNTIAHKITDGTHRTPKYIESGIPFLRINDLQNQIIDWDSTKYISEDEHQELIKRCKPEKGDILLSKNGTIGITRVISWDQEFSIFVSLCLIKPDLNKVSSDYLSIVIGSDFVLAQVKKRSKQGTVTNLHLEEIRDFDIPLPDKREQQKIVDMIRSVDAKLANEILHKKYLMKLKTGLMQDIFNQKVRIN